MIRHFLGSATSSAFTVGIGLITGIIAARALGPEGRGLLGIIIFWPTIYTSLLCPHYGDAIVRHSPINIAGNTEARSKNRGMNDVKRMAILLTPLVAILVLFLTWLSARNLDKLELLFALGFAVVFLLFFQESQMIAGRVRSVGRFDLLHFFRVLYPAAYLVACLIAMVLGGGVAGFVLANITAMLFSHAVRSLIVCKALGTMEFAITDDAFTKTVFTYHFLTLANILALQVDRMFVISTKSTDAVGIYLVAVALVGPLPSLIGTGLSQIALPALVKMNDIRRQAAVVRLLRNTVVAALSATCVVALSAPIFTPILFGVAFAESGWLAAAISLAASPVLVRAAFEPVFKSENKTSIPLRANLVYIAGFLTAAVATGMAGFEWPVVYGIAAGNFAGVGYLSYGLSQRWPAIRARDWAVPTPRAFLEFGQLLLGGVRASIR